jgi:hypothetical protein
MVYTLEIADALIRTVGKFVTLNNYQLAGHVANLDFWTRQIKNALDAVDGYPKRQRNLQQSQKQYISAHDTRRFSAEDAVLHQEYPYESMYEGDKVRPDKWRIDSETLKSKRREIVDSFYRFLLRCHQEKLVDVEQAHKALSECGIGIEPGDFRPQ